MAKGLSIADMYHHTWLPEALSKEVSLIASLLENSSPRFFVSTQLQTKISESLS